MMHFVGFVGGETNVQYARAVEVFGRPDFVNRFNDARFVADFSPEHGDRAVFANGEDKKVRSFSYNDSEFL
jgi:hypothetical protein